MCAFLQYCLSKEREAFIADLRPKYILPNLVEEEIITSEEGKEILSLSSIEHQVIKFLHILSKKGRHAFGSLVKALQKENAYPWLADKLLQADKEAVNKVDTELAAGGVPFQVNFLVPREAMLNEIQMKLQETCEHKRQWVVLHGMVCCGKTILAAEAVRDVNLVSNCFPGGVYWIAVGNIQNENCLLHRMQILWEKLKCEKQGHLINDIIYDQSEIITVATRRLKEAVSKRSKLLVILDDVWTNDVIDAFDIGCHFLVTTRNAGIVNTVYAFSHFIPIDQGFNLNESRKFLSEWVKASPGSLPDDVDRIHKTIKGSPQILSAVGGIMARFGNHMEMWAELRKKLEAGNINAIGRKRKSSSDKLEYLNKAVEVIMDNLDKELLSHYQDFAVFQEDIYIPNQVLEIIWGCEKYDVELTMSELAEKSLIQRKQIPGDGGCSHIYAIHDIFLDYLKNHCSNIKVLHKKVVNQYICLCMTEVENQKTYNYGLLPDDGYIHHFIAYHLYHAEEFLLFPEIFFDLKFIQKKLQIVGPSDLLNDYFTYRSYFNNTERQYFENFIKKNSHLISEEDTDIIQLALLESPSSLVHQKAKHLAALNYDKFYLEICNHASLPDESGLRIKLDVEDIKCAVFSPDGQIIVAGGHKMVKMWNSTYGRELKPFSGHKEIINCCTFNSKGSMLATASNDKTVKLWSFDTQQLLATKKTSKISACSSTDMVKDSSIFTFQEHEAEVLCCAFSPTDDLIISSDWSGRIFIWRSADGTVTLKMMDNAHSSHHRYPVNYCKLTCNSIFITSSESLIKMYSYPSGKFVKVYYHNDQLVTGFCCTKNQNVISTAGSTIYISDVNDHEIPTYFELGSCVLCCSLSYDECFLAIGTTDSYVNIWNLTSRKLLTTLNGHKDNVQIVSYSNDGSKLLSLSSDGLLIAWDLHKSLNRSVDSFGNNLSVHLSDELIIATSDISNCMQVLKGLPGNLLYKNIPDDSLITACSISPDGSKIVYGTKTGSVKVLVIKSRETLQCVSHDSQITYLIHMKNNSFITCSEDTTIRVWQSWEKYTVLKGHLRSVVMCVAYSRDTKLLSCSEDGICFVWNTQTEDVCFVLNGHESKKVTCCDVSDDEKILASASTDCTVKLWSSDTGIVIRTLHCSDCVRCCRFSPKSSVLVAGEDSGIIRIWDLCKEDYLEKHFDVHSSWVKDIKFSADGKFFVTVAEKVKIWTETYCFQTLVLPGAFTQSLWVSPDFKIFVILHNSVIYILNAMS